MAQMVFRTEPELRISVERGKTKKYSWEISYSGSELYEVLNVVLDADQKLRKHFGDEEK